MRISVGTVASFALMSVAPSIRSIQVVLQNWNSEFHNEVMLDFISVNAEVNYRVYLDLRACTQIDTVYKSEELRKRGQFP